MATKHAQVTTAYVHVAAFRWYDKFSNLKSGQLTINISLRSRAIFFSARFFRFVSNYTILLSFSQIGKKNGFFQYHHIFAIKSNNKRENINM